MGNIQIRDNICISTKNGICYQLDKTQKTKKFKPWLGDVFSFLYDRIMEKSVFPKKFKGSITRHHQVMKNILENVQNKRIIEFATGSGDMSGFLNGSNGYAGVDISTGLLRIARKKFDQLNLLDWELFVADACDTPFPDKYFDLAICSLSLNFFDDIGKFISEVSRVLKYGGLFYCIVPVPEKKNPRSTIHGKLYSEEELKGMFEEKNFEFECLPYENGALLYFKAVLRD